ncbi:helix-turn-helix domain-containing protein [Nocardia pseudovaccinii]|uniref:helix-turn-helix domain-containing protein n=1 Tax=Nocardia pseudovaccinii TaxID=189540 RepID=UPI001C3FED01|nr:helix-turn-helix domain-containing protein [Nocardia pseudovaccinii]
MDFTVSDGATRGFDAYRREWAARFGADQPMPTFSPDTVGDFRVRTHAARMRDLTMIDMHSVLPLRTGRPADGVDGAIQLYVVSRGAWTWGDRSGLSEHSVSAGQFLLQQLRQPKHFDTQPHTTAKIILGMPQSVIEPLLRNRIITGPADSAEMRLLVAHANMVRETMADLSEAGERAAQSALVELVKAVVLGRFDDVEPQLAAALTQAAKELADRRLADPDLSSAMLARELNVSLRTLQRAFASVGESPTAYIRHRRLEEARLALTTSPKRLSIGEIAAYWHFSDSSHLIRSFKKTYGLTPAEYARSAP